MPFGFVLVRVRVARSNKDSIVFRLRLTCIRVWWGVFTLILNRIPIGGVGMTLDLEERNSVQDDIEGDPDTKKHDILLNLGARMGQNRSKSAAQPSCTACAR